MRNRTTASFDGVSIAYSVSGSASTALLFIHGGMSDRSFWDGAHAAFADRFRVLALDLAGHGESGRNRTDWGVPQFGRDALAVLDAEDVSRAVLVGNSLGGPAAVEAALLAPSRALAVIGVDTFQDIAPPMEPGQIRERVAAWRSDPAASMDQMMRQLLHPDTDPGLYGDILRRNSQTPIDVVCSLFLGLTGYDAGAAVAKLTVPLRCVNGDKYPTNIESVRRFAPGFDAVILPHTGHYPMLECPAAFHRALNNTLRNLGIAGSGG